jgi:hypothetical protein
VADDDGDEDDEFLGLYAEEPVLGGDSRFLLEAGVKFGRMTTGPVADEELPESVQQRVDVRRWRRDRLTLPFELQFIQNGRFYIEAQIRLSFADPDVRSVLFPPPESPGLEPHVSFATSAVGHGDLAWLLTSTDAFIGIAVGGRQVQAVVESPISSATLAGTLDARAKVVSRTTRRFTSKEVRLKAPQPFMLNVRDGAFEFCKSE